MLNLAKVYLFKINHENAREMCEICLKLAVKSLTSLWCVFIVNLEHTSHLF